MFRFREGNIYKEARNLRLKVAKDLISRIPDKEKYNLISQIDRTVNSIILNIAEGSYRKTDKDLAHFLNQALASLYEFVAALDLLLDSSYIGESEHRDFCDKQRCWPGRLAPLVVV